MLTYIRAESLRRLLDSLAAADYDNDLVDLEIWMDGARNMNDVAELASLKEVAQVASAVVWEFGSKRLVQQPKNMGLVGQWLSCNMMNESGMEPSGKGRDSGYRGEVVIFEDDLQVSRARLRASKQICTHTAEAPSRSSEKIWEDGHACRRVPSVEFLSLPSVATLCV